MADSQGAGTVVRPSAGPSGRSSAGPGADRTPGPPSRITSFVARHRIGLLVPAMLALLIGMNAGLDLLGVPIPIAVAQIADAHGMLLVAGFLGTLISLERAAAANVLWGYASPLLLGVGAVSLLTPVDRSISQLLILAGSALLALLYVRLWRRQPADAVLVQALGAVLLVGAVLLWWAGLPLSELLPWLAGFPVLTIAGERLELARVGAPSTGAQSTLLALGTATATTAVATLLWPQAGYRLCGAALVLVVVWLLRYDVARHTVRGSGLPRFSAACLLAGYAWLAVAAAIWIQQGPVVAGSASYDAVIHSVFLGFVLSMIFAHAPIILPAVLRCQLPYRPVMYAPFVMLQVSLLVRVGSGDGLDLVVARQVGGIGNVAAVLLFAAIVLITVRPRR